MQELGGLLTKGTLHLHPASARSYWYSCATFVLVSHSLSMLWAVPWITSMLELQARRAFLREQGRSPDNVPWLVVACCEHGRWGWLVVVGLWALLAV